MYPLSKILEPKWLEEAQFGVSTSDAILDVEHLMGSIQNVLLEAP